MATTNTPWELYGSDLKPSKMAIKRELPSMQFDIPIPSQPPKYQPGSGPPPPRIDLRLVHDTNAFIIDKIVLPLEPFTQRNDPRQRRAYYIVGWPDLPAARPVVAATDILDYVSPRTLEDWEYQDALRREEAREAEERAKEKGKALPASGITAGQKPGGKRKRGRPPKARLMDVPPPEPVLDNDQEEMLQRRKSGPSLSTPQKSRLAQLVAEEEILEQLEVVEEEDPVSAVQRQLKSSARSGDDTEMDEDALMELWADAYSLQPKSAVSGASDDETSLSSSSRTRPAITGSLNPTSALSRVGAAMATTTSTSPLAASFRKCAGPSSPSRIRPPVKPPISNTPIPLPSYVTQSTKHNVLSPKPKSQTKMQTKRVMRPSETSAPTGHAHNTYSPAEHPEVHKSMDKRPSSSLSTSPSRDNGFTPIGSTFPRPMERPSDDTTPTTDTPATTQSKRGRKRKQAKLSQPEPDVGTADDLKDVAARTSDIIQGEEDFVVKRLEGDYMLDGIHWFKVRWQGDWPPDQNPTWEPKSNISAQLVRQYLKRKAKREAEKLSKNDNTPGPKSSSNGKSKRQSSLADWAKGYNSVAEAFEGKAELDATTDALPDHDENGKAEIEGSESDDELFVVEQNENEERETAAQERKKLLDAQLAAQVASIARGGPRQF